MPHTFHPAPQGPVAHPTHIAPQMWTPGGPRAGTGVNWCLRGEGSVDEVSSVRRKVGSLATPPIDRASTGGMYERCTSRGHKWLPQNLQRKEKPSPPPIRPLGGAELTRCYSNKVPSLPGECRAHTNVSCTVQRRGGSQGLEEAGSSYREKNIGQAC